MRQTEQRQGLRMLKLRDVLSRWEVGSLSQLEAAEVWRDVLCVQEERVVAPDNIVRYEGRILLGSSMSQSLMRRRNGKPRAAVGTGEAGSVARDPI